MIVVRVKHFADQSCEVLLLNGLMIITAVKALKVKVIDCFGIPDAKRVYNVVAVADNREVIRDCANGLCALLRKMLSSLLVSRVPYITAELYFAGVLRTLDLKRVAVCKPVIRTLYLITVANLLLEHSVLIADTATVCGISECSKRIEEASRKTAEAAVTERCIGLLILDCVEIKAELLKSLADFLVRFQIDHNITERAAHQKFHRKVVNGLRVLLLELLLAGCPAVYNIILYGKCHSMKDLLLRSILYRSAVESLQIVLYVFLKVFLVDYHCKSHPFCRIRYLFFRIPSHICKIFVIISYDICDDHTNFQEKIARF